METSCLFLSFITLGKISVRIWNLDNVYICKMIKLILNYFSFRNQLSMCNKNFLKICFYRRKTIVLSKFNVLIFIYSKNLHKRRRQKHSRFPQFWSLLYVRKYWNCENFSFLVFNGFTPFGMSWIQIHYFYKMSVLVTQILSQP